VSADIEAQLTEEALDRYCRQLEQLYNDRKPWLRSDRRAYHPAGGDADRSYAVAQRKWQTDPPAPAATIKLATHKCRVGHSRFTCSE
jgi:hypothetical protein